MRQTNPAALRSTKKGSLERANCECPHACEHLYNGHYALSRQARHLLRLLQTHFPSHVIEYMKMEFASETRRNQNMLTEILFEHLVNYYSKRKPEDKRLTLKFEQMKQLIYDNLDSARFSNDYDM